VRLTNQHHLKVSEKNQDALRAAWRKSYTGLAAVAVFSVFINILKLATPLYVLQILDRVISSRSHETLVMLTLIALVAIISGILLEIVRQRMFLHWGGWFERSFGPRLFTLGFQKDPGEDAVSSKMLRDVATIRSFVSGSGLIAWLDVIWAPIFIGCVFLICAPLSYVVITAIVITLVLGTVNELITRDSRDITYKARKDDREWIASAERNRETVGSLNMAANIAERWSQSAFERLDEGIKVRAINLYFEAAIRFVGRCLRMAVLGFGVWLVINQNLTLGTVIAVSILGRTSNSLVAKAMLKWREMLTARRAYERIRTALKNDISQQVSVPKTNNPVPLHIKNISYRYPNQSSSVFRGIEVTVEPGEVLCVIGQSAMGKTTLSRLVSGLMSPRSGKILLGDIDVSRLQQIGSRRVIGHLPQDVVLFQGTVRENIARMGRGNFRRVVRAAKLAGIHETILKLPQGYDTEIADNEPLLSAGQRKGIAIARSFYGSPQIIVMDEPTQHLDERACSALITAILRWKRKGVIVVITMQSNTLSSIVDKVILFKGEKKCEILQTRDEVAALGDDTAISNVHRLNRREGRRKDADSSRKDNSTDNENFRTA
jgi:PrtD family type I secretion system ABC transporter